MSPQTKKSAKKVLLIGWDAADWKSIHPLLDKGLLPNLKKLIDGGVMGTLTTLDPPLSPTLWTSISTGKRPYQHGILGFTEPTPDGKNIRPIHITSRKTRAIWNILSHKGYKSHQIGWWPSHPAEPINGISISNFYQRASAPIDEPWPMMDGIVYPPEKAEWFKNLRVHPGELTQAHLKPFVPDAAKIDQTEDKKLVSLAKIIADCSTIQSAATYILAEEEWDFLAVYFDAIDHFGHGFMKYSPPKQDFIPRDLFDLYKGVIDAGYRYHDMMLGRLMELAGEETTIILVSDHGFSPGDLRPNFIPKEPAGPAVEHSPYGIIVMNGPGIKKDALIHGASLLDISPTILSLYGLPIGRDMDGKVLVNAFEKNPILNHIPSWDKVKGNFYEHPKNASSDETTDRKILDQLVALGYIDLPNDPEKAVRKTVNENNFYLARSYMNGNKYQEATPILEQLFRDNPTHFRYGIQLIRCYQLCKQLVKARHIMSKIRNSQRRNSAGLDYLEGTLFLGESRFQKATELFQKVALEAGNHPGVHLQLARCYMSMNKLRDAQMAFQKELDFDAENAAAHHGLGLVYLKNKDYDNALKHLLETISLQYYFPTAHFHIGETLLGLEDYENSAKAYELCLKMKPDINKARKRLAFIYRKYLNDPQKAEFYNNSIPKHLRGTVTIVSGLPRSGTSLMMQMLEKGGMDIFTDGRRSADDNNPKGYYEHEGVKKLMQKNAFIKHAENKAIKVIANLLHHLPPTYYYKIIFMERDLKEIVQSQQKMLSRLNHSSAETYPLHLVQNYEKTLKNIKKWLPKQTNMEILFVPHHSLFEQPFEQAIRINEFLNCNLRPEQMVEVIDHSLYREMAA